MLLGEVAPAAPALAALIELAVVAFTFAATWLVRIITLALLGWLIDFLLSVPAVGKYLAYPIQKVEQGLAYALGKAEHALDHLIGASWHQLARYTEWLWREIRGHAVLALEIASGFYPIFVALRWLNAHALHIGAVNTVLQVRVKKLEREYHGIDRELRTLEREYHGIDQVSVRHRLGAIEKELGTIESQTIPAIQQAEHDSASAINNLYEWAKGKASLLGVGTFATAVAAALGLSSLAGFGCNAFRNIIGRGCSGLWSGLDNLLGLFFDLFFLAEICDVLPLLETAVSDVAVPLVVGLTDVGAGLCDKQSSAPAPLTVAPRSLVSEPAYPVTLAA